MRSAMITGFGSRNGVVNGWPMQTLDLRQVAWSQMTSTSTIGKVDMKMRRPSSAHRA